MPARRSLLQGWVRRIASIAAAPEDEAVRRFRDCKRSRPKLGSSWDQPGERFWRRCSIGRSLPWCRRSIERAPTPLHTDDLQEDVRITPNEVPASAAMQASALVRAAGNPNQRRNLKRQKGLR